MFAVMGIATGLGDLSQGPRRLPMTPYRVAGILAAVVASIKFEVAPISSPHRETVLASRREHWMQQQQPAAPPPGVLH
jgi:hypothetical protein